MSTAFDPRELGADCKNCPFFKKDFKPVRGEVPESPRGILVGEGPGQDEEKCGRPFVGQTGTELNESLQRAGLDRRELAVVYATCCKPPPIHTPDQKLAAAKCCRPVLTHQLKGIEHLPKFLMGTAAAAAFTPIVKGGVEFMRGFIREEINAIISWNPTYAFFKNPYEWGSFEADLGRFKRILSSEFQRRPPDIVTNPSIETLAYMGAQTRVAVDIETAPVSGDEPWTGKDPTRALLRSVQIGTSDSAVSFLWDDASEEAKAETKRILEDPQIVKVWCNGFWFDLRILRRYGINPTNNEDLRDMRCALSATSPLSLRYMASLYCGLPPWKELGRDDTEK